MSLSKAHHVRRELCTTRPAYRSGRQLRAVKVYTVSQESRYLLVQGVPALGVYEDLIKEFALYGAVEEYRLLDEYPAEEFTEVLWVKFVTIQSARLAKRKLDDYEYCGGKLHVCYAPEYETVDDTRSKLEDRRRSVARRLRQLSTSSKGKAGSESVGVEREMTALPETSSTPLSVELTPVISSQRSNTSSVNTPSAVPQPAPPPPPPPPLSDPLVDPTFVSYFPSLPPPPVEHFPVRFPPDVRWRFGSAIQHHLTTFPFQPFHRPPVLPTVVPQPFNSPKPLPAPVTQHSLTLPHSDIVAPETSRASLSSFPTVASTVSKTDSHSSTAKSCSSKPVIKDYVIKGATPRFIPRQLSSAAGTNSDKTPQNPDPVIQELKQNAFVLSSKVQGPSLPSQIERKRKEFKSSETGSESLDKTVKTIRQKVSHLTDVQPAAKKLKEV